VNEDKEEYLYMYKQPMFRDQNKYMDMDRFLDWFDSNVYKGEH
jgi:hypothetical protein